MVNKKINYSVHNFFSKSLNLLDFDFGRIYKKIYKNAIKKTVNEHLTFN